MERYDITVQHVTDLTGLPEGARKQQGLSLAIGFFDGVHSGHREVVRQAVTLGKEQGLTPSVMTFDPHPRVVLGQGSEYHTVLTPLDDKLELLADLGVEAAYIIRFDRPFSEVSAEQFVKRLIVPLGVRTAVVGFDFSFGHRGAGDAEALGLYGGGDIQVHVIAPVFQGGDKVSSTRIREMLAEGECREANVLLGRTYEVKGFVVHGEARGREIGFPTANVMPEQPYVIPRPGVYAIQAELITPSGARGERHNGVLNVGYRPTFEAPGGELKLEAHLFDFQDDLYGCQLAIKFHSFLRPERKFASIEQLTAQIASDADEARRRLTDIRV
ncbi:riboflavin biosynthesis protein RibF [Cohnella kolymensis]|uniref:Riboflavin biosynthesis protein n=1 Tax=Cohnella kolymensis TaxID=1590652 RepID=A0ABR5A1F5_9BACL|nr:bifunctional riboflavin kinase/FAD synthetase [Cohnella kolymensis]KIL34891.1 riboflavin biosynthesis protein RibF [Cohnella kolymensis]